MYKDKILHYFMNTKQPVTVEELCEKPEATLAYDIVHGLQTYRTIKTMFNNEFRKFFRKYCKEAFDGFEEVEQKWLSEFVPVPVLGKVGNTLYTILLVDYEDFSSSTDGLSDAIVTGVAAKGKLYGCADVVVFVVCRNTQKTFTLMYGGDFQEAYNSVLEKAQSVKAAVMGGDSKSVYLIKGRIEKKDATDIGYQLSDWLESLNERGEEAHRKDTKIHPSEFTYSRCDKRQVYRMLGYEAKPKVSGHLRKIFDYGHSVHEVVQDAIRAFNDIVVEERVNIEEQNMTGSCDGYLDGVVLELKSKGHKGFEKLTKPQPEHVEQATIYAAGLGLDKISIVYVNKNTGEIKEFLSDFDPNIWYKIKSRVKNILYHRDTKTFPSGIDKKYKCKECPYLEECHPEWVEQ